MEQATLYKSNTRLLQILSTFAKYGIADWLNETDIEWIQRAMQKRQKSELMSYSREERVRMALTELGTTFIKLGQVLSTRTDLIPIPMAKELAKLQANAPSEALESIHQTIVESFDQPIEELFASFSPTPMASASIAQVHEATLHSGEEVVVKVVHRGIEKPIHEDLRLMQWLASLAEKASPTLRAHRPAQLVREFKQTFLEELDFNAERNNILSFISNFEGDKRVEFPTPFEAYSNKKVLTMKRMDGVSIQNIDDLGWDPETKSTFMRTSLRVFLDMLFKDRFYHADPHPGNLLVTQEGVLQVIDCGMVGRIDKATSMAMEDMVIGLALEDTRLITEVVVELCDVPKDADLAAFERDLEMIISNYMGRPLNEIDTSKVLSDSFVIVQRHQLNMPSNVSTLGRMVVMLEGTARMMDPTFNLSILIKDYQFEFIKHKFNKKYLTQKAFTVFRSFETLSTQLPEAIANLVDKRRKNRFAFQVEQPDLHKGAQWLVKGLLTAMLFLCATLLLAFHVGPLWQDLSIIGLATGTIALFLGLKVWLGMKG